MTGKGKDELRSWSLLIVRGLKNTDVKGKSGLMLEESTRHRAGWRSESPRKCCWRGVILGGCLHVFSSSCQLNMGFPWPKIIYQSQRGQRTAEEPCCYCCYNCFAIDFEQAHTLYPETIHRVGKCLTSFWGFSLPPQLCFFQGSHFCCLDVQTTS